MDRSLSLSRGASSGSRPGPYVLAGHSNGGLFARRYATIHPAQVKGLVLIDTGNYRAMLNAVPVKPGPAL